MPLSFAPMPRGAFTGFQMIFLFLLSLLPEAESECRVCQPASWMKQAGTHSGQSGKNDCCRPAGQVLSDRKTIILPLLWFSLFTLRWCLFHFGGSLFYGFSPEVFFYPICLCFRLPPFCAFQWAASVSHFRSGRKGNFGIGRESKVKPPVFCGNLQPCG